jgi:phage terminase large subunit
MAKIISLPHNFTLRPYQKPLWNYLESGGKRAIAAWHRRAGKDEVCMHWTAVAAHQRVGTYWTLLPEAAQARKAIWDAIDPHSGLRRIDAAFPKAIRETTHEGEMKIKFKNGSLWQVVGSDNYHSLCRYSTLRPDVLGMGPSCAGILRLPESHPNCEQRMGHLHLHPSRE